VKVEVGGPELHVRVRQCAAAPRCGVL